jgi:hypothetical protein
MATGRAGWQAEASPRACCFVQTLQPLVEVLGPVEVRACHGLYFGGHVGAVNYECVACREGYGFEGGQVAAVVSRVRGCLEFVVVDDSVQAVPLSWFTSGS